jgi:hypothetical protein
MYPSYWTESYESFKKTKEMMCFQINYMMDNYEAIRVKLDSYNERQMPRFFGFENAIEVLFNG